MCAPLAQLCRIVTPHPGVRGQSAGSTISTVAKKSDGWTMAKEDVGGGIHGSSSGHSKPLTRSSRRDGITSSTVFLVHYPSGLRVEATVPPGRHSRKEMIKERERLNDLLWEELERKVATHLRIPGQQSGH
jgi:hypothetical protein